MKFGDLAVLIFFAGLAAPRLKDAAIAIAILAAIPVVVSLCILLLFEVIPANIASSDFLINELAGRWGEPVVRF